MALDQGKVTVIGLQEAKVRRVENSISCRGSGFKIIALLVATMCAVVAINMRGIGSPVTVFDRATVPHTLTDLVGGSDTLERLRERNHLLRAIGEFWLSNKPPMDGEVGSANTKKEPQVKVRQAEPMTPWRPTTLEPMTPPTLGVAPPLSEFHSRGKLPLFKGGDAEDPEVMERLAKMRSYRGEIVFAMSNEGGTKLLINWAHSLRAQGFEHYIAIVGSPSHCKELWSMYGISCVWTTYLTGPEWTDRLLYWKLTTKICSNCADAFQLWMAKFHYMRQLVDRGLNVMCTDTDLTFQSDMYKLLKAPPLADKNLLVQKEGNHINLLNIGFIYCQNCVPGRQAYWVFKESQERILFLLNQTDPKYIQDVFQGAVDAKVIPSLPKYYKGPKNMLWDQHTMCDVIETSITGKPMFRRSHQAALRIEFGIDTARNYHKWRDWGYPHAEVWPKTLLAKTLTIPPLQPGQEKLDTVVSATTPLISTWSTPGPRKASELGDKGWWLLKDEQPPVTHFVGCLDKPGCIKAQGWFHYEAEYRGHPTVTDPLLAVRVAPGSLNFSSVDAFQRGYFGLLARLVVLGRVLGRKPVAPPVPCDSGWINRRSCTMCLASQPQTSWFQSDRADIGTFVAACSPSPLSMRLEVNRSRATGDQEGDPTSVCCSPVLALPTGNTLVAKQVLYHFELEHKLKYSSPQASQATVPVDSLSWGQATEVTSNDVMQDLNVSASVLWIDLSASNNITLPLINDVRHTQFLLPALQQLISVS